MAGQMGGLPTAPQTAAPQGPPPPQAGPAPAPGQAPGAAPGVPPTGTAPGVPDGAKQVSDALRTILKLSVSLREKGQPDLAEAMKPILSILTGAGSKGPQAGPAVPPAAPEQPQGAPTPQPVQGGNIPLNA